MLTWTQLRHPSSGLIRSLTALNRGQIEKLRPTFKPALKTHQSSSVVVAPDKRNGEAIFLLRERLSHRPRKCLDSKTPVMVFSQPLPGYA